MSDDPNIDRLFQESFKDFQVDAPKNAWANIEKKLSKKSRRRVFPIWLKLGAAAAIIAVLILAGSQWFLGTQVSNPNNSVVDTPQEIENTPTTIQENNLFTTPNNSEGSSQESTDVVVTDNPENNSNTSQSDKEANDNTTLNQNQNQNQNQNSSSATVNVTESNKNTLLNSSTNKTSTIKKPSLVVEDTRSEFNSKPVLQSYVPLIASVISLDDKPTQSKQQSLIEVAQKIYEEEITDENTSKKRSWFIKPQIAPTFYGNLGEGSAIDASLSQNSGQGQVDMSYGVNVAYQLNDRIKIRSGINRVNLNYATNNVYLVPDSGLASFNNANLSAGFESSVLTLQQLESLDAQGSIGRFPTETSELQQQLGYIEVPMEVEYKLLDKAININIIGGASTLLLSNNNIDIQTGDNSTSIGEANNINNISFSSNFAIGFDYDISERFMLNLEPTFKYQINTFQSGTTDFQPYFFGIYSGLIFKF
jgi:hypothetical protein